MPGKHRRSPEDPTEEFPAPDFGNLLYGQPQYEEPRYDEPRYTVTASGRHRIVETDEYVEFDDCALPESDLFDESDPFDEVEDTAGEPDESDGFDEQPAAVVPEPVEPAPVEPEDPAGNTWSLPTIPIRIPSPRKPVEPAWTAAAWCGDIPRQSRGRGRHRAGNTGSHRLPGGSHRSSPVAVAAPMFPSAPASGMSTRRISMQTGRLEDIESSTGGTVRSVAILAAVATGAVVVATQDEAEAAGGTAPEPTGGESREVRIEPRSVPIPLPEVLTLSRDSSDDAAALERAVSRDEHAFKAVGTPYLPEAGGDQVDRWIAEALGLMGLPMSLAPGVRNIVMKESGGDPNAINLWDSNARKGIPSQGLMQTIPATYQACVLPSLADRPITDPVANITAGVRAMIANHGVATLADGGRKNSAGRYIGYGGGRVPGADFISTVTGQLRALPGML